MKLLQGRPDLGLAALAAVALLFTRPTALGELYTLPGMIVVFGVSIGMFLLSARTKCAPLDARSGQLWAYVLFALFLGFQVLAGLKTHNPEIVVKQVFVVLIGAFAGFVLIADRARLQIFFDVLAAALVVVSCSVLVTLALIVSGRGVSQLGVGVFSYGYPPPAGAILFPFSMIYNYAPTWVGMLPRLSGCFREVGIFPAFACWAAGYASFRGWRLPFVFICLAACALSFSSLGVMLALMTAVGVVAARMKLPWWAYVFAPVAVFLIVTATYDLPYIGIGYKYRFVSDSYAERMNAMQIVGDNLLFGGDPDNRNAGINLISAVSVYGLVGVALLVGTTLLATRRIQFFAAVLAAPFAVALFSEPIAQEPLFVLLFVSWRVFEPVAVRSSAQRQAQQVAPRAHFA